MGPLPPGGPSLTGAPALVGRDGDPADGPSQTGAPELAGRGANPSIGPDLTGGPEPAGDEKSRVGAGSLPGGGAGDVFAALADRTRRHLLERLSEDGPLSATDLAGGLPISRQAVVKHLAALGAAGLVHSDRRGREVLFAVEAEPLRAATDWLEQIGRIWDRRLVALVKHLSE